MTEGETIQISTLPLERFPSEIAIMIAAYLDPVSPICWKKSCRQIWQAVEVRNEGLSHHQKYRIHMDLTFDYLDSLEKQLRNKSEDLAKAQAAVRDRHATQPLLTFPSKRTT